MNERLNSSLNLLNLCVAILLQFKLLCHQRKNISVYKKNCILNNMMHNGIKNVGSNNFGMFKVEILNIFNL